MGTFDKSSRMSRDTDIELLDAILRESFVSFIRKTFNTLNPGTRFLDNWHIEAIAWWLEQVRLGRIKRLIITMPPRSLKSISASVAFPAYVLGMDPTKSLICVSYGQDLAAKHQNDTRAILNSSWYRRIFPATRISSSKNSESEVMLTKRGLRYATSVGGTLTGRGADIIIIDDALKASDAYSDSKRNEVNEWYGSTLVSRLNDKQSGAIVIVTQRVHADDLVGFLLDRSGDEWTVLNLPAIAPVDEDILIGEEKRYARKAGSALHADREPLEILESIRATLGAEAFAAQYLQLPIPSGGLVFKREWLRSYDQEPFYEGRRRVVQSWDTASKVGASNDYSVCTTWLIANGNFYLLDLIRGRFEFPTLKAVAIQAATAWRPERVLIEDTGIGTGLIHELKLARISAIPISPVRGKEERARIQTAKFDSGRVLFPEKAPWLPELVRELLSFPEVRHDDQVDSVVQLLGYFDTPQFRVALYSGDGRLISSA